MVTNLPRKCSKNLNSGKRQQLELDQIKAKYKQGTERSHPAISSREVVKGKSPLVTS